MPRLKKCPDCGGKMERRKTKFIMESEKGLIAIESIDADICTICGVEYLTAEADEYIEKIVEKILIKKIQSHQEAVFRVAEEA
ncbi:MAG: YgiT-type zinc finger protein [Candidatus Methanoperedens sp.]|nr:YgiT-type zinc finger protein [Candidatus Methanoperedens sp.]